MLESVERCLAVGYAEISGDVVEGAAFHNPSLRVASADVFNPLPCIAEHVEERIGAGLFLSYVVSRIGAVAVVPGNSVQGTVSRRLDSAERGILPLGFERETHADAIAVRGGGAPVNLFGWPLRAWVTAGI